MTDLMSRPILRVKATPEPPSRPLVLSGAIAGLVAAAVGVVLTTAATVAFWFAGNTGSFADAMRAGAIAWLVGNGSGVEIAGVGIGAVPLGLTLCYAALVYRAAKWAGVTSAVRDGRDVASGVLGCVGAYAVAAVIVRTAAGRDGIDVGVVRLLLATMCVALVAGGLGVVRGSDSTEPVLAPVPSAVRACARGAVTSIAVMLAAAALMLAVSLIAHFSSAVTAQETMATTAAAGIGLTVVGLALVPNAVLCAGAFVAGPGFAVGQGTVVAPDGVAVDSLPGLPLLAAVPSNGTGAWWQPLLILLPVLAGAAGGIVALRRDPVFALDIACLRGAVAGLAGGVGFGTLTWLGTGAVGPGRMQQVGPDALATTLVCALSFLIGGALAAGGARWWESRRDVLEPPADR